MGSISICGRCTLPLYVKGLPKSHNLISLKSTSQITSKQEYILLEFLNWARWEMYEIVCGVSAPLPTTPLLLPVLLLCWYTTCLQCILLRLTCGRVQYSPVVGASGQLAILGHPLTRAPAQILTAQVNLDIWLNISPGVHQHLAKGAINKNRPNEC